MLGLLKGERLIMDKWEFLARVLDNRRYVIKYNSVYRRGKGRLKDGVCYNLSWRGEVHRYTMKQLKEFKRHREPIQVGVTQVQIDEILALIATGMKQKDISILYNIHQATISNIKRGKVKAHKVGVRCL